MQITEPGKYRMRNGGVAEVTTLRDGYVLGYKEAWAGKSGVHTISGLWARSTGYNFCQRDSDLIARIYGSDDSQPSKDSEHHFSGTKGFARRFENTPMARVSSCSDARRNASAEIAKIPFDLARWIGECFYPRAVGQIGGWG